MIIRCLLTFLILSQIWICTHEGVLLLLDFETDKIEVLLNEESELSEEDKKEKDFIDPLRIYNYNQLEQTSTSNVMLNIQLSNNHMIDIVTPPPEFEL